MSRDNRLTFAIDCDEVLRPTLDGMIAIYNRTFPENRVNRDDIKDFKVDVSFPTVQEKLGMSASVFFFDLHSEELFVHAKPYPNVAKDIKTLQEYGNVIILTHQKGYKNKAQTLQWLYDNGIEPDSVCFSKDKTIVHADYFIDDNDWNFVDCNCAHGVLISAPYNKDVDIVELGEETNCKTLDRCASLHDFVEHFTKTVKK